MAKHFSEKERKQIMATLCEVGNLEFSKRGLRAARIEDICRAVGISKGSFYNFYDTKEQLFLAIVEQRERIYRDAMRQLVETFSGEEKGLIDGLFDITVNAIRTDPFIGIMLQPGEIEHLARKMGPEQMAKHQSGDFAFFADLTKTMQSRGYCTSAQLNTMAEISVLIFCLIMQAGLLPVESFDASLAHLNDLLHFKLSNKGA